MAMFFFFFLVMASNSPAPLDGFISQFKEQLTAEEKKDLGNFEQHRRQVTEFNREEERREFEESAKRGKAVVDKIDQAIQSWRNPSK